MSCIYKGDKKDAGCTNCDGTDTTCFAYTTAAKLASSSDTPCNGPESVKHASEGTDTMNTTKVRVEVESGVSKEIGNTWYRFGIKIGREVQYTTKDEFDFAVESLWEEANDEVDAQIQDAFNAYNEVK